MFVVVSSRFLGDFGAAFRVFFDFKEEEKRNKNRNGSKTTKKPRRDDNEQLKYDLTVLVSPVFTSENGLWINMYRNTTGSPSRLGV